MDTSEKCIYPSNSLQQASLEEHREAQFCCNAMSCTGSSVLVHISFGVVQSLSIKPKLATATGLASHQGNVGKQQRTGQATSSKQQSVSSTAGTAASTTPITVGGRTVNVFVSALRSYLSTSTHSGV